MSVIEGTWIDVGLVAEIPKAGARVVGSRIGDIAIFRAQDGHVFALRDRCPHKGGPISQGIVHGHSVTCPLHNWVLSLVDGQAEGEDQGCARRFGVRVDAGRVLLDIASLGD